jgi:predicted GNAT family acetyltransferase
LYVNAKNLPARAAYERVGFEQTAEFATVMW